MFQGAQSAPNCEPLLTATLQQLMSLLQQSPGQTLSRRNVVVVTRCLDALSVYPGLSAGHRHIVRALAETWARWRPGALCSGTLAVQWDTAGRR